MIRHFSKANFAIESDWVSSKRNSVLNFPRISLVPPTGVPITGRPDAIASKVTNRILQALWSVEQKDPPFDNKAEVDFRE